MLELDETGRSAHLGLTVNGKWIEVDIEPRDTLAWVLRQQLGMTGTKIGCDAQVCGACTVLVDERPVSACTIFAYDVAGGSVMTIEGLADGDQLHPVQRAFIDNAALQCGYCTPGQIMACVALLSRNPQPTREDVINWLEGNTCRCTGYDSIVRAALDAASELSSGHRLTAT